MQPQSIELCPHCDPYPVDRRHHAQRFDRLLSPITDLVRPFQGLLQQSPRAWQGFTRLIFGGFFRLLLALGILRDVAALDSDATLYNRTLVVVREARSRGITIRALQFLGAHTNFFTITMNGKKQIFEGLPHLWIEQTHAVDFSDKGKLKTVLKNAGLPHPTGRRFHTAAPAIQYVQSELKFPVVVKPVAGSLSQHTTCAIRTDVALTEAIRIAQIISREFIVEQYIEGNDYRITMVDGTVVAACLREPPNVIGDGQRSIQALIDRKNEDPLRGELGQRNRTLHKLAVSAQTAALLQAKKLTLNSVPAKGKKVYLHTKVILAAGADIHDVTDGIHPDNVAIFEQVAALCQTSVLGIDVIAQDLKAPYDKQPFSILEVNSLPYIDMHHYPVTGQPRNVAGHILDSISTL